MSLNHVGLIGGMSFAFTGLANERRVFADPDIRSILATSVIYFVGTAGLEMFLGTPIALLLHCLSRATNILGSSGPAMVAAILMNTWEWTPLVMLIVLAGLAPVPAKSWWPPKSTGERFPGARLRRAAPASRTRLTLGPRAPPENRRFPRILPPLVRSPPPDRLVHEE